MNFGFCPDCTNKLTTDSALVTKSSSIFKGNNFYVMCKNCNQVLLYNADRDMLFDLNEYKDEQDVLDEINQLLSEVDNHYEVASPCQQDCSKCEGCDSQFKRERAKKAPKAEEPEEEVHMQEMISEEMIKQTLENHFLAINKIDPNQKKILTEQEFSLIDVNNWTFFELMPVEIKPVITYKVVRH